MLCWRIVKIRAKDFGSFDEVDWTFDRLLYLVRGTNWDVEANGQHVSNGSGKTSFIDVIPVCLFGISVANRKLYSCVREGYPYFRVSVLLRKDGTKDELYVERTVYSSSTSTSLVITFNGLRPKSITTKTNSKGAVDVVHGQAYVYDILGLSKEQILSYFCIGSNGYVPFPLLGETGRVDTINNISGAIQVDRVVDMYREEARIGKYEKEKGEREFIITRDTIEDLSVKLKDDECGFVKVQQRDIKALTIKINSNKLRIKKIKGEIKVNEDGGQNLKREKENLVSKLRDVEKKAERAREMKKEIDVLEAFVVGSVACPSCGSVFVGELKRTVADVEKEKKDKNQTYYDYNVGSIKSSLVATNKAISVCDKDLLRYASVGGRMEEELKLLGEEVQDIGEQIKRVRDRVDPFKGQKDYIEKKKSDLFVLVRATEKHGRTESRSTKRANTIGDFRRHLCNKTLVHVEGGVNRVLRRLGSPFTVKIERFKKLRNKEVRQSINPIIFRGGIEKIEYNYLSRGEQGVINMSFDLALRDVINGYSGAGLEFYCNDEKLSVIDEAGITAITQSFENGRGGLMLLCTHSAPTAKTKSEIRIEKRKGVSCTT